MQRKTLDNPNKLIVYNDLLKFDVTDPADRVIVDALIDQLERYELRNLLRNNEIDTYYIYLNGVYNSICEAVMKMNQEFLKPDIDESEESEQKESPKECKEDPNQPIISDEDDKRMKLSYHPWNSSKEVFSMHKFIPLSLLVSTMITIKQENFQTFKDYMFFDDFLKQLDKATSIVNRMSRFPEDQQFIDVYVDVSMGVISEALNYLCNVYQYLKQDTLTEQDKDLIEYNNARIPFQRIATRIIEIASHQSTDVLSVYGIYNQKSFEKHLRVEWLN
ncbi:uncharacterized protein [Prorops nasuta]|uniref:uncharacterized protein n=1 Tax=Prorops nasuta TaxID=863751 RepID=UPI0034CD23EF